jgi:hypothetical protein
MIQPFAPERRNPPAILTNSAKRRAEKAPYLFSPSFFIHTVFFTPWKQGFFETFRYSRRSAAKISFLVRPLPRRINRMGGES